MISFEYPHFLQNSSSRPESFLSSAVLQHLYILVENVTPVMLIMKASLTRRLTSHCNSCSPSRPLAPCTWEHPGTPLYSKHAGIPLSPTKQSRSRPISRKFCIHCVLITGQELREKGKEGDCNQYVVFARLAILKTTIYIQSIQGLNHHTWARLISSVFYWQLVISKNLSNQSKLTMSLVLGNSIT